MSSEVPVPHEREAKQQALVSDIEQRIKTFSGTDIDPTSLEFDYITPRLMIGEGTTWRDRRDANDIGYLVYLMQHKLDVAQAKIDIYGSNPFNFDPAKHSVTPDTVIALYRQQLFNWEDAGEPKSRLMLNNVLMYADRRFYMSHLEAKRGDEDAKTELNLWFNAREHIEEAVRREEHFPFNPTQFEDVGDLNNFGLSITRPNFREGLDMRARFSQN